MDIEELLTKDRISFNLKGLTKEEVIDELIEILFNDNVIEDKHKFKIAVMKREEEFSTGIGNGIGIPHGKSKFVTEAAIAFGISKNGVDFDSMDGEPAHLIFLIAVPEKSDDIHLKVLSYISRRLMHNEVRQALIEAENYDDIIKAFEK
ncbi:PTS sugar transporter subunit IIA [Anaerosalibacter bizertensis]|uniref:PTS sugar transporter subunit IIA n=1 Tax=Anaerosalibacter bizertensis TaxID=932217 RepID=A0A844FHW0_9FIRM|nr:PTS sugar transporter subunit IIA [Anaerosalibacter bizertensis]MBV1817977.1 PTS sugar transporter subunit IIA [Bacteroidales bacterium MSK.15.36]HHV25909.1 PTS sugar transporter subunit IIA [Tissierellia bacterium]MBU5294634.1 PTS sugar transporter subunit IIA [Anaerosalibacter bizertensis]MCB5559333.1 PTS sugar transporter subunit IIA [Anaerosalibacter bizertensis]MCG4565220.1 PTS sugar transporter subunit IIA [Anaerosalibacter bizertensis]